MVLRNEDNGLDGRGRCGIDLLGLQRRKWCKERKRRTVGCGN